MNFYLSDHHLLNVEPTPETELIDYGVKLVGAPLEWKETRGEGIKVGVIDTGVDIHHVDLRHRIKEYINFTSENRRDILDQNGHGTHEGRLDTTRDFKWV